MNQEKTQDFGDMLRFEHVSVEFEPGQRVLNDLSFSMEQGQTRIILVRPAAARPFC